MKIISVVGARPNFIKILPFINAIRDFKTESNGCVIDHKLVHTGQHFDLNMSDSFFTELNIDRPDYNLGIGSGSHAYQVGQTMIEFEKVLLKVQPDWVVVVGDVNATLACSVTAKKHHFKVAHIEAGLRSNDWTMPEEINRIITDRISDLLLTPCHFADANLLAEGIPSEKIVRVGNIMIDTMEKFRSLADIIDINEIILQKRMINDRFGEKVDFQCLKKNEFIVLTLHRPANVDDPIVLRSLISLIIEISEKVPIVFPMHPRTRKKLEEFNLLNDLINIESIFLTEPLSYINMMGLNLQARMLMTDSGGLQEEATVIGVPCLTMRLNTERPITLASNEGTSYIVGNEPELIRSTYQIVLENPPKGIRPALWDGHTAERIVEALVERS